MRLMILGAMALLGTALLASAPASADNTNEIKVCSGGPKGKYHRVVEALVNHSKSTDLVVIEVPTNGSWDNLQKLSSGECDAAMVQSDAWGVYAKQGGSLSLDRLDVLYKEYVHLYCNRKAMEAAGIDDVTDIENRKDIKITVGAQGGGTEVTWKNFGLEDSDYAPEGDGPAIQNLNDTLAINKVKTGDVACGLYVGGLNTEFMGKIEALGDQIALLPLNDSDFNDAVDPAGNPVYTFTEIPGGTYPKLQAAWGSDDTETLALDASVLVTTKWENENPNGLGTFADLLALVSE